MSTAPVEVRRRAAQSIEHAIEWHLEMLQIPVPEHSWIVDGGFSEFTMTYKSLRADQVSVTFTADELDCFDEHPKFATLTKIDSLATILQEEHQRLAK